MNIEMGAGEKKSNKQKLLLLLLLNEAWGHCTK